MTITSRYTCDEAFTQNLVGEVEAVPLKVLSPDQLQLPVNRDNSTKKNTKRHTIVHLPTGITWDANPVVIPVRLQPHHGKRGRGEAVHSNFRNCLPFSQDNRGVKLFVSGSIQGWGFRSVEEFTSFTTSVLEGVAWGEASVNTAKTKVALAIYDAKLQRPPEACNIHLRAFAKHCRDRVKDPEFVDYSPEEFAGIKIKLPHPTIESKRVSVTVRAKGSIKVHLGNPADLASDSSAVWARVGQIVDWDAWMATVL